MKSRFNIIVLALEIVTIGMLHAIKMNHTEPNTNSLSSHIIPKQPDFHIKPTFTLSSFK